MKKRILPGSILLLAVALIAVGSIFVSTGCGDMEQACEERLITVLNPEISSELAERVPLAPRAETLEGKTIYFVDMQWGGPEAGYSVFEELKKVFAKEMPTVKVVLRRAKDGWMGNDPALQKEIADNKAAGVLIGIGG